MTGGAKFTHDECIKRNPKGRRHFPGDRKSAAGEAEDDNILTPAVCAQQIGQYPARFATVTKDPLG
jgi:hypothetical protein